LKNPNTIPLAGGTYINTKFRGIYNVVDLQNLGLDSIVVQNKKLEIGSTTKLQKLYQNKHIPDHFRTAIKLEAPLNFRNSASLGGLLLRCNGRSPIATSLLALNAMIVIEPGHNEFLLSDFFSLRSNFPKESIITSITLPENQHFCFNYVARTPVDLPIVCVALSTWKNGRTRLALGGYGIQPLLVVDGDISDDISTAAYSAYSNAEDEWASAEYRSNMARVLSRRCLSTIISEAS
jgi:CO/xanthine dehydrogenase FAD-binding subunit